MRKAGIMVRTGALAAESDRLNEAFNHWIVHRKPWVLCKCAMSLDGKIATNSGESKWISSEKARHFGMQLRLGADAIVAGVNTILRDDPALTLRPRARLKIPPWKRLRRIILDPEGRTPESARILSDEDAALTTLVVTERASPGKIAKLEKRVQVFVARTVGADRRIDLRSLLRMLGSEGVVSILVEGGGETHFNFLRHSLVNRIHFFFAPLLITGRSAPKSVAGNRTLRRGKGVKLSEVEYTKIGPDLLCSGTVNC